MIVEKLTKMNTNSVRVVRPFNSAGTIVINVRGFAEEVLFQREELA
jgi:hypothetical protein